MMTDSGDVTRVRVELAAALALGLAANAHSQTLQLVDTPSQGAFFDIVASGGQQLVLGDDGEAELGIDGYAGNFVVRSGLVVVGQNGGVGFGQMTITDLAPVNQPIPSQDAFIGSQAALVFWDDIDDKEGDVHYLQLVNDAVLGTRLIIQWNYLNFDGTGTTLRFQVHVLGNVEPTGIYAQYIYEIEAPSTGAGRSATIGYQDGGAGFGDIQFSFNTRDAVGDATVVSLMIPDPADLDGDGRVGITDFLLLLGAWGPCPDPCPPSCYADLDGGCNVDITDLLILLENWTA